MDTLIVLTDIEERLTDLENAFSLLAPYDRQTLKKAVFNHIDGIKEVVEEAMTEEIKERISEE